MVVAVVVAFGVAVRLFVRCCASQHPTLWFQALPSALQNSIPSLGFDANCLEEPSVSVSVSSRRREERREEKKEAVEGLFDLPHPLASCLQ